MNERARRVGLNEAMFRDVNERIEGLNRAFATITETMNVVCECGDATCVEQVVVSVGEYERIRDDPDLFMLVPGHEQTEVEEIVEHHDRYVVVGKLVGEPERTAEATDPRR